MIDSDSLSLIPAFPAGPAGGPALEALLEALLLAAEQSVTLDQLQKVLLPDWNLSRGDLRQSLDALAERLEGGVTELKETASGYRLQIRPSFAPWISRLWQEKPQRFSRALLETLALIVYRQPITRGEIEEIRGVAVSSNILRTLLERGWVREVGHKEVLGRPVLFGTTPQLLDDFSLKSLDQLPALPEVKDLAQMEAALLRLGAMPALPADDAVDSANSANSRDAATWAAGGAADEDPPMSIPAAESSPADEPDPNTEPDDATARS